MIGIAGAGAFGTALAVALARAGHKVRLWARDPASVDRMRDTRRNEVALPGIDLPEALSLHDNIADICGGKAMLLAVPMQSLAVLLKARGEVTAAQPLVACCKGIDLATLRGPVALIRALRPGATAAILTGPSFATDIARGLPTALTLAAADGGAALQARLSTPTLRRGYAEMVRLAEAMGARAETLAGLSGLGDLVLTCTSHQSRNFRHGLALGRREASAQGVTVEGIATARAVVRVAAEHRVDMPVATMVDALASGRVALDDAIGQLLRRPLKPE
ncbi:MAG: hypothetical protein B7Z10_00435 [Rhodobacterales bacterium 32-66-7]|nr:MAG: hypothetical protein B7Z10_00435 [Rhodobacterales bacterium 32-66-7]